MIPVFGQGGVVQFSGMVVENPDMEAVSFCAVYVKNRTRGTIANDQGFFSIAVQKGDTIVFQSIGYKTQTIIVPENWEGFSYIQTIRMEKEAINLKEIVIRPLPPPNLLRQAIINLDVPDDLVKLAEVTFANSQLQDWSLGTDYDGAENFNLFVDKVVAKNYYAGQYAPIKLLDIASWAQFIKAVKKGEFKKKPKKETYFKY